MLCYKLVRRGKDDQLYSLFDHRYCIRYTPGLPAVPMIGLLFVFVNVEDARDACAKHMIEIWECDAKNLKQYRGCLINPNREELNRRITLMWNRGHLDDPIMPPYGTFSTEEVTLIKPLMFYEGRSWHAISAKPG